MAMAVLAVLGQKLYAHDCIYIGCRVLSMNSDVDVTAYLYGVEASWLIASATWCAFLV